MTSRRLRGILCMAAIVIVNRVSIVLSAPDRGDSSTPFWHRPCGDRAEKWEIRAVDKDTVQENMKNLKIQYQIVMNDYLDKDYDNIYERAKNGVHKYQYIPNWLPGAKDVLAVEKLKKSNTKAIVQYLPKFHLDLQKFAVALEQMVKDESSIFKVQRALLSTQSYLKRMICELETSIIVLQLKKFPDVERSIMSYTERHPVDDTQRLVRDWGVMHKYKDYLRAWQHVFKY